MTMPTDAGAGALPPFSAYAATTLDGHGLVPRYSRLGERVQLDGSDVCGASIPSGGLVCTEDRGHPSTTPHSTLIYTKYVSPLERDGIVVAQWLDIDAVRAIVGAPATDANTS